jgi:hypothetical protein
MSIVGVLGFENGVKRALSRSCKEVAFGMAKPVRVRLARVFNCRAVAIDSAKTEPASGVSLRGGGVATTASRRTKRPVVRR